MSKKFKEGTICVQGGYSPKSGESRVLPLYQSTTYKYNTADELADLFDLKAEGHMYSRISNPTVDAFEKKLSELEGGVGALALASGQAAITTTIFTICKAGDHILSSSNIYGGTFNLFNVSLKKLGIEVTFFDPNASYEEIISLAKENTKCVYAETFGNPSLNVLDFKKLSDICNKISVPFIVDNTLATAILCKPFEFGANIVVYSTTKYIDGHASCVGGAIIDGGNFDFNNGKFEEFTTPDESYHGVTYVKDFGRAAFITKARVQLLRDYGNCMSPFNAYLTNFGLETLHLRMKKHSENALKVSEFLQNHPKIGWVNYPYSKDSKTYELAKKYLKWGSGVLTFGIKGGVEEAKVFIENLKLIALVTHVADTRSCVLHPASTTHRQLSEEEQIKAGVTKDLIRLSVGIEDVEDIIEDLNNALDKVQV